RFRVDDSPSVATYLFRGDEFLRRRLFIERENSVIKAKNLGLWRPECLEGYSQYSTLIGTFQSRPATTGFRLVEATLRTDGRPVMAIPTWCVRLWSVLQSWMTGLTLTGLTCPLNLD
ncbi:hypothetical protein GBAR_LOCUS18455, partial [Geodia barretti]